MKTTKYPVYTKNHRINSYEIDRNRQLSIRAILNLFQDLANVHAELLGFGYEKMLETNRAWVLNKMRVEIMGRPMWNDEVELLTWTQGMRGLLAARLYQIKDKDGKVLINGDSDWLVIDTLKRRPLRLPNTDFEGLLCLESTAKKQADKLPEAKEPKELKQFEIRVLDIDMMGHVNNINYLAWVLDSILLSPEDSYFPLVFEVNFVKELKYPGVIAVEQDQANTNFYQIRNLETGKVHFKMRID